MRPLVRGMETELFFFEATFHFQFSLSLILTHF
jgi:hypothetical protein